MTTTDTAELAPNVVALDPALALSEAEKRRARIRRSAESLIGDLVVAWRSRDWLTFGLPSWEAYVDETMPEGLAVKLEPGLLVDRLVELTNEGMTVRAAGPVVGVSKSKAAQILAQPDVAARITRTTRTGLDGREQKAARTRRTPTPAPASVTVTEPPAAEAPRVTTVQAVVDVVAAAGPAGATVVEVGAALGWHHGQASGALSKAERRGRLVRTYVPGGRFGRYRVR